MEPLATMPPAPGAAPATHEAERLARSFVLALRNASIYPADHPRARGAVDQCLALTRERAGLILTAHDQRIACNGRELGDDVQFEWVIARLRSAALRGVVVAPDCKTEDLLELARRLVDNKPTSSSFEWPADHSSLQTVPLVFTGTFGTAASGATGDGGGSSQVSEAFGPPLPPEFGLGKSSGARVVFTGDHASSCHTNRAAATPEAIRETRIQELLASMTDGAAHAALVTILTQNSTTTGDLDGLDARPRANLGPSEASDEESTPSAIDSTLELARKYFGRPLPEHAPSTELPSGRAEDAAITGDLDDLLAEIAALPDNPNPALLTAAESATDATGLAEQLLGIYLYLYVVDPDPTARSRLSTPIRRALAQCGERTGVLDAYLGGDGFREISDDIERLELLDLAGQADRHQLIRDRGYLDAELVVAGFPQCMPLACKVLGGDPPGLAVLADAIERLVRRYGSTTFVRILRERSLQDPSVVRALLAVGGQHAHEALSAVAWSGRLELFTEVIDYLNGIGLPPPERKALAVLRPTDLGGGQYLQDLLRTFKNGKVSELSRKRTAELLRRQVHRARESDDVQRLTAAIADLALVPDANTRELLDDYAGQGRWKQIFDRLNPARAKAREVLAEIAANRQ